MAMSTEELLGWLDKIDAGAMIRAVQKVEEARAKLETELAEQKRQTGVVQQRLEAAMLREAEAADKLKQLAAEANEKIKQVAREASQKVGELAAQLQQATAERDQLRQQVDSMTDHPDVQAAIARRKYEQAQALFREAVSMAPNLFGPEQNQPPKEEAGSGDGAPVEPEHKG